MTEHTRLPQHALIDRLRTICRADERLVAAMLYGSFALGESDQFSDIDTILYFNDESRDSLDQLGWVSQIAPVALYYHNEFGNGVAIFESLIRAEFHFDRASDMHKLAEWRGTVWFPSADYVILVDKSGELARQLEALFGPPPRRDTAAEASFACDSLLNWFLVGANVLARGEAARALEILHLVHDYLLRMARLLEGQTGHWVTPTRAVEHELSDAAYERYRACTATLEVAALWRAYRAAHAWGSEMIAPLAQRFDLQQRTSLVEKIGQHLERYAGA